MRKVATPERCDWCGKEVSRRYSYYFGAQYNLCAECRDHARQESRKKSKGER